MQMALRRSILPNNILENSLLTGWVELITVLLIKVLVLVFLSMQESEDLFIQTRTGRALIQEHLRLQCPGGMLHTEDWHITILVIIHLVPQYNYRTEQQPDPEEKRFIMMEIFFRELHRMANQIQRFYPLNNIIKGLQTSMSNLFMMLLL